MKMIVIAGALAMGSTLALAQTTAPTTAPTTGQGQGTTSSQERAATPSVANSQLSKNASDHWTKHAKDGYMTREQTMSYRGADGQPHMREGKPMDFDTADTDKDGRISEREWQTYHSMDGNTSSSGATGGQSTGGGATGSGTTAPAQGAQSGSTPRN